MNAFALLGEDEDVEVAAPVSSGKKRKKEKKKKKRAKQNDAQEELPGEDIGFSLEELKTCVKVLDALGSKLQLLHAPMFRPLRSALHPLVDEQLKSYSANDRGIKRKREKDAEKDRYFINKTGMRAKRQKALQDLCAQDNTVLRILDGAADVKGEELEEMEMPADGPHYLSSAKNCYTCKKPFRELHFFYDQLCPECAALNFEKREQKCDLRDRIALVTGGRVKIGYRIVLKLLRCGATVIVTTRFPKDCAERFAKEEDFEEWGDRVKLYGLDFRNIASVEAFCAMLCKELPRLDIIINNACQTVRRPPAYYQHLLDGERKPLVSLPSSIQKMVAPPLDSSAKLEGPEANGGELTTARANFMSAAESTQMQVLASDSAVDAETFPEGVTDVNGQQVDLRRKHSWTMKLHEVPTPELAEVFAINAIAPTIFNAKLKPLMERMKEEDKFIVNVSAMEGKFYRFKSDKHPHTNMAKAALNMMTRTSAPDYRKSRIFMTAVDTGWINDENPLHKAAEIAATHHFQTPIDEIDAAARVLDPVIGPLHAREMGQDVEPPFGYFIKDYVRCEW